MERCALRPGGTSQPEREEAIQKTAAVYQPRWASSQQSASHQWIVWIWNGYGSLVTTQRLGPKAGGMPNWFAELAMARLLCYMPYWAFDEPQTTPNHSSVKCKEVKHLPALGRNMCADCDREFPA